jgi:uncharacterized protein (DUF362 family)
MESKRRKSNDISTAEVEDKGINRRDFLKVAGTAALLVGVSGCNPFAVNQSQEIANTSTPLPEPIPITPSPPPVPSESPTPKPTRDSSSVPVAFIKTDDRVDGIHRALGILTFSSVKGRKVLLKPNFNSSDPFPGSTHNDTLRTLIESLWEMGAKSITVADRSGMGNTRRVMEQKGILALADELGFDILVLDELVSSDWATFQPDNSHWSRGFLFARPILEADIIIQTCCLKTHRYGGHFTISLKNSVGMVAKYGPDGYNYMQELHNSPNQRKMIAEINAAYKPSLVIVDATEAFVRGGPAKGEQVKTGIVLAGTDRIALDAVGVAVLRFFGTTPEIEQGRIFEQEQIAHAVSLGLGISRPEDIELLTDDADSAAYAEKIQEILLSK